MIRRWWLLLGLSFMCAGTGCFSGGSTFDVNGCGHQSAVAEDQLDVFEDGCATSAGHSSLATTVGLLALVSGGRRLRRRRYSVRVG